MLYPALAIFSMVACSRLPFGNPSLRTCLVFFMRKIPLGASARIHLLSSSFREISGSAGGLARFDNSGNDPIRGMVLHAVSPHPGPLPWGEGEPCSARRTIHTRPLSTAQCSLFPLPEGEGQGEGKETVAPPLANVLASASDYCPEDHMASSHSSFQASALPKVADLVEAFSSHWKFNSRSGGASFDPAPEFLRATTPQSSLGTKRVRPAESVRATWRACRRPAPEPSAGRGLARCRCPGPRSERCNLSL